VIGETQSKEVDAAGGRRHGSVGARGGVHRDGFDHNGRGSEGDAKESELRVAVAVESDGVARTIGFLLLTRDRLFSLLIRFQTREIVVAAVP